ncbi:MAG: glycosyl hydrolase, partial [Candidatus Hydrogenedentes bacterium]|nr:glycosyl hydrolase [Candidatus Hydrogenedentota bacterium]
MSHEMRACLGVAVLSFVAFSTASAADRAVESWVSSLDMSRTLAAQERLAFSSAAQGQKPDIVVDDSKTYQTILGLGSSLEHSTCANLWRLEPAARSEVMGRLVSPDKGIGMNLMRICIGTPDFTGEPWYSYDDMPAGQTDEDLKNFSIEKDRAYV